MTKNLAFDDLADVLNQPEAETAQNNTNQKMQKEAAPVAAKKAVKPRVPVVLPEYVILRTIFSTYVSMPGHPTVRVSREFLAGQRIDDPRDIAFLIQNRAIIEYPKDYVI